MENGKPIPGNFIGDATPSRRHALALMLGAGGWLPRSLAAAESNAPIRMAISESLVSDVNLNDARAAMLIWLQRITRELNVVVEFNPKVFDTTQEILGRIRRGELDAVAVNVIEYRQVADILDPSQIVSDSGETGTEEYVILAKRDGPIKQLGDLQGRRLYMLKTPKMCVAPAWLSAVLDEARFGPPEQFFASVVTDTKPSRVVLPVFFGQVDACLTSKRGFDTMCEMNPQVSKELRALAASPPMMISFYVFCRNFARVHREKLIGALTTVRAGAAGRQLAMLFQFDDLTVRDASCLTTALAVLDRADRVRSRKGAGGRKG